MPLAVFVCSVNNFVGGATFVPIDSRRSAFLDGLNKIGDEWCAEVFCGRQCLDGLLAIDLDDEFVAVKWAGD